MMRRCVQPLHGVFTDRRTLLSLGLGQCLALLITGTGVTSQYLASDKGVSVPTFQSSVNYFLLLFCYFPYFVYVRRKVAVEDDGDNVDSRTVLGNQELEDVASTSSESSTFSSSLTGVSDPVVTDSNLNTVPLLTTRSRPSSLSETFKEKGWFYLLLAFADVEANYLVVKAYLYTSITSVMLLDCFSIPCVMVLSFIFLKSRFRLTHYVGVVLCLSGLGILVSTDSAYNNREVGDSPLKGDLLCLGGAFLYSVSNVGQEGSVKRYDRVEYLAMLGVFGSIISLIQMLVLERGELSSVDWTPAVVALMFGYGACLFLVYSLTPYMLLWAGSTLFNLSLLSSDVFAIIAGIFLFHYTPSVFYFVAFLVIIVGLICYNVAVDVNVRALKDKLVAFLRQQPVEEI